MGIGTSTPVVKVDILQNKENPSLIRSDLEYLPSKCEKTFTELKKDLYKRYDYHYCVLQIHYYDKDDNLIEYPEANNKNVPLKILNSKFKTIKEKNIEKVTKKNTIPIILLNDGICICEKLINERVTKIIEEKYKGKEEEHKNEIEKLLKQREDAILRVKNNMSAQNALKEKEILELKKRVEEQNKEHKEAEKKTEEILQQLEKLKAGSEENPNNKKSFELFNKNRLQLETKIYKMAKGKINDYFDFHQFKEKYKENMKKFQKIVEELLKKENYEKKLSNDILTMLKENPLSKDNKITIKHFNILVLGPSGVGKSTLINSILLLDEDKDGAKTDVGIACTKGPPKQYESKKIEGIRLFDTQGIEMGEYNITAVQNDAKNLIQEKITSGDPDKYIHCIWYCVSETRFHTEEMNCLKILMDSYNKKVIPIIIVYGKAVDETIKKKMLKEITKFIKDNKKNELVVIPLLAKEMANVKPYGRKELLDVTVKKLEGALESSCYEGMRQEKLKEFQKKYNENLSSIEKEYEKEKAKKKIEITKENYYILFKNKITKMLGINFKEDNLANLSSYIYKMYDELNKVFDEKMKDFCIIYGDKLFSEYFSEYERLDAENHSGILKSFNPSLLKSAQEKIRNELEKEIKNEILPKIYREIENQFINSFKVKIEEKFNEIIIGNKEVLNELKSQIDKIVSTSYKLIHEKIQKCRQKNDEYFLEEEQKSKTKKAKNVNSKQEDDDPFKDFD